MLIYTAAVLLNVSNLHGFKPFDTAYLIANKDSLLITTYHQQIPQFYQCDFLGRCQSAAGKDHSYKVDVSLGDESSTLSLKIQRNNQLQVYPYGKFDHELHRQGTSNLLLVSEDTDNTGTYTRAFFVEGDKGQEIDVIKGTSFSQDDIRLAETGVLRLYYQNFGAPASGVLFDEFSTATRWYYPIDFAMSGCINPMMHGFTADQQADIFIAYECDNTLSLSKNSTPQVRLMRLKQANRTTNGSLKYHYWVVK